MQVLNERDKHCHLYSVQTDNESLLSKHEENLRAIADQRYEINLLLKKVHKYSPKEFSDYPSDVMASKPIDLTVWKLTREAESDE